MTIEHIYKIILDYQKIPQGGLKNPRTYKQSLIELSEAIYQSQEFTMQEIEEGAMVLYQKFHIETALERPLPFDQLSASYQEYWRRIARYIKSVVLQDRCEQTKLKSSISCEHGYVSKTFCPECNKESEDV